MQTLQQLLSGELKGIKRLKLSCELKTIPHEVFDLADTLEILDLSDNQLFDLPANFGCLQKLKIAFFSDNCFTEFPSVLSQCPVLTMIGIKSNQISHIPENAFPKNIQWLILTNNQLTSLPKSIGNYTKLKKVALAGNLLQELPEEMARCTNIELLRISANKLTTLPDWLFKLPRLSWLAYSANPCHDTIHANTQLSEITWNELEIQEQLGAGASGIISKAYWKRSQIEDEGKHVAVKVFKGEVTSDGIPEDEINTCITAGSHLNLIPVLGRISHHPLQKQGLVFELIPSSYTNLGQPPSFETCTRDTYPHNPSFSIQQTLQIVLQIASVSYHLHSKGILHGDLYAHNMLVNNQEAVLFGDFGAATIYGANNPKALYLERLEVRAFGCLLEDLLNHTYLKNEEQENFIVLEKLKNDCMQEDVLSRPSFLTISDQLNHFKMTEYEVQ